MTVVRSYSKFFTEYKLVYAVITMSEQRIDITRSYPYDFYDFAVAFHKTAVELYGEASIQGIKQKRFLRKTKISRISVEFVKTSPHEKTKCIVGPASIVGLADVFLVGKPTLSGEFLPSITAYSVPVGDSEKVEQFFDAIEKTLKTKSIYKGKAITADHNFVDFSENHRDGMVYSEAVMRDLEAYVWSIIAQSDLCAKSGIPLQRKILFTGPYGSGKTMAAIITAQLAVKHGWTVVYLSPTELESIQALKLMYEFTRLYVPAVVIIEDIDAEQRRTQTDFTYRRNLEVFDGFVSKKCRIVTIMTTNRPKEIGAAMQRPGRIDTTIDFSRFNQEDAVRLLRKHISDGIQSSDIDWETVGIACREYAPAFVLEVATSAKLLAISTKTEGQQPFVTHDMLIQAADDLRDRHKACQNDLGLKTLTS